MIKDLKYFNKKDEYQKIVTKDILQKDPNLDYQGLRWNYNNRQDNFDNILNSIKQDFCVLKKRKKFPRNFIETKKGIFDFSCYYYRKNVNIGHFQLHNCCKSIDDNNFLFLSHYGISCFNFFNIKSRDILKLDDSESISYSKKFNFISGACNSVNCYLYDLKNEKMIFNKDIFSTPDERKLMNYSYFLEFEKSILIAGNANYLSEVDLSTLQEKNKIKTKNFVNHLEQDEKSNLIGCAMDDKYIQLIDNRTNENEIFLKGHEDYNFAIKFLENNKIITGGQDITSRIWDLRKYDKEIIILDGFKTEVAAFEYVREKNLIFVLELFGFIYCYDLNGNCIKRKSFDFFSFIAGMSLNLNGGKLHAALAPIGGIRASGIVSFDVL